MTDQRLKILGNGVPFKKMAFAHPDAGLRLRFRAGGGNDDGLPVFGAQLIHQRDRKMRHAPVGQRQEYFADRLQQMRFAAAVDPDRETDRTGAGQRRIAGERDIGIFDRRIIADAKVAQLHC